MCFQFQATNINSSLRKDVVALSFHNRKKLKSETSESDITWRIFKIEYWKTSHHSKVRGCAKTLHTGWIYEDKWSKKKVSSSIRIPTNFSWFQLCHIIYFHRNIFLFHLPLISSYSKSTRFILNKITGCQEMSIRKKSQLIQLFEGKTCFRWNYF